MSFEYILQCEQIPNPDIYNEVVTCLKLLPYYKLSYSNEKSCGFVSDFTEDSWGADIEVEEREKDIFVAIHIGDIDEVLNTFKKYFLQKNLILEIKEL